MSHVHVGFDTVQKQSCDYDCTACNIFSADECDINGDPKKRPLTGWKFSLATIGVFAFPMLCAILGTIVLNQSQELRFMGGIAGFATGTFISMRVFNLLVTDQNEPEKVARG